MAAGSDLPKLGIIAGAGALPALLAAACRSSGRAHAILGLSGFAQEVTPDAWIGLGEFGKGIEFLRKSDVHEVVMAGAVRRPPLAEIKADLKGAAVLARLAARSLTGKSGDNAVLSALIEAIEQEGFRVVGADDILAALLTPAGVLGCHQPTAQAEIDIRKGIDAARELGAADIGQAVIVRAGEVVGREDAAGTDALMERCAAKGGVLVKMKKPRQERRVDLPTIGPRTVANAAAAGLHGIAVEAGNSLILDRAQVVAAADAQGLFVVGIASP
jgi:hypothetical protein